MIKLQEIRKNANKTQWELSLETMIPIGSIQKYENGSTPIDGAKIKTLAVLARALNVKIEDLLEDQDTIELLRELYK